MSHSSKKHRSSLCKHAQPCKCKRASILQLPSSLLLHIFKGIHVKDFLSCRQVCKRFHEITENPFLWSHINFHKTWPDHDVKLKIFDKAAECNNFEALTKLALKTLYHEGVSHEEGNIENAANLATDYFCRAEVLSKSPFAWILLRPPWSSATPCCKLIVFNRIKERVDKQQTQSGKGAEAMCVAQTMCFMDHKETLDYFHLAMTQKCPEAATRDWLEKFGYILQNDKPVAHWRELEAVRELRGMLYYYKYQWWYNQILLARCYASGKLGGITSEEAWTFTQHLFRTSSSVNILPAVSPPKQLSQYMRYILVDWLVEVASTLGLQTRTVMNAVTMVDKCLVARDYERGEIQLLGISALLLTSRYMAKDILTVREAAWYTDNTYTYGDVVKMMGEIIAILKGEIFQLTTADFADVVKETCRLEDVGSFVVDYILELCMLDASMAVYSPAMIAASAGVLARVLLKYSNGAWLPSLTNITGFSPKDLVPCIVNIHSKCLQGPPRCDSQAVPLQGVKTRFSSSLFEFDINKVEIPSAGALYDFLGEHVMIEVSGFKTNMSMPPELPFSPSCRKQQPDRSSLADQLNRENAGTPMMVWDVTDETDDDNNNSEESFYSTKSEEADWSDKLDETFDDSGIGGQANYITTYSKQNITPYGIKINISNISFSQSSGDSLLTITHSDLSVASSSDLNHDQAHSVHLAQSEGLQDGIKEGNVSMGFVYESIEDDVGGDMSHSESRMMWDSSAFPENHFSSFMQPWQVSEEDHHEMSTEEHNEVSLLNQGFYEHDSETSVCNENHSEMLADIEDNHSADVITPCIQQQNVSAKSTVGLDNVEPSSVSAGDIFCFVGAVNGFQLPVPVGSQQASFTITNRKCGTGNNPSHLEELHFKNEFSCHDQNMSANCADYLDASKNSGEICTLDFPVAESCPMPQGQEYVVVNSDSYVRIFSQSDCLSIQSESTPDNSIHEKSPSKKRKHSCSVCATIDCDCNPSEDPFEPCVPNKCLRTCAQVVSPGVLQSNRKRRNSGFSLDR